MYPKGKDLSESGKQKPWTHFLLKIQILKGEWWSHLPMKRKKIRFAQPRANLRGTFSVWIVHWRMAQPFTVKNLNFEQKMGYGFYLPDSLMSQPLETIYSSLDLVVLWIWWRNHKTQTTQTSLKKTYFITITWLYLFQGP